LDQANEPVIEINQTSYEEEFDEVINSISVCILNKRSVTELEVLELTRRAWELAEGNANQPEHI